jgi:hypothetical protein
VALVVIVNTSWGVYGLQRPLVTRPDLPPDLAGRMLAWISDDLRERLGGTAEVAEPAPDANAAVEARALAVALELRDAGKLTADLLGKALRAGKSIEFDALLARFCHVSIAAARRMQASRSGEALAVALKAQGVDKGGFATLFMLCRKARDSSVVAPSDLARAVTTFDRLTSENAARRLATLQASFPEMPAV